MCFWQKYWYSEVSRVSRQRVAPTPEVEENVLFGKICTENCMKMKEIRPMVPCVPSNSPTPTLDRQCGGCLYSLRAQMNLSIRSVVTRWIRLFGVAIYVMTINVNSDLFFSGIDDSRQMEPLILNVLW